MEIDLHTKNQINICKRLEKSSDNCLIAEIYQVQSPEFCHKPMEGNETQT